MAGKSKLKEVIITIYGEPSKESLKRLAKIMKKIYYESKKNGAE